MLCRMFELILIKIGFLKKFKVTPKLGLPSTGSLAKFHQKCQGENSAFL